MSLKNIRNSFDTRSTNHQGNLLAVVLCFSVALTSVVLGLTESGDARQLLFGLATIAAVLGFILGLVWLNAKEIYFSENPEEFIKDPMKAARDAIGGAKRKSSR